jgi:hypothetical protein
MFATTVRLFQVLPEVFLTAPIRCSSLCMSNVITPQAMNVLRRGISEKSVKHNTKFAAEGGEAQTK